MRRTCYNSCCSSISVKGYTDNMDKTNVIMLCDYGLDDAAATAFLLQNSERFGQIDLVPIGGNVPLDVSQRNAHRILYHFDGRKNKVRIVDTASVPQSGEFLKDIHGNDGIGDILPAEYEPSESVVSFDAWVDTISPNSVLVSLGPCTVTQRIMEKNPTLPLVLMAGNISEAPNYMGYEFNHGMDTDAFAASVKYPHVIATLDTCHHPLCDFYGIENKGNSLLHRFCKRFVELSKERNEKGAFIYDLIALQYLYQPESFSIEPLTDQDGNRLHVLRYIAKQRIISLSE
ncbi:MAG TPA: hypothetical protein DDY98_02045 [Ruminococcaceae bacterium]|nr:hypothetical protein [Oscillospiraceae bacterium]